MSLFVIGVMSGFASFAVVHGYDPSFYILSASPFGYPVGQSGHRVWKRLA